VKAFPWVLVSILVAVVMWGYSHPRTVALPTITTVSVRDSARADSIQIDTVVVPKIKWLRSAPVDTMAAILRDRASRPVLLGTDTVFRPEPSDSTSDSACLPQEVLAATAARQLADSANLVMKDWQIKIERTRGDSAFERLDVCLEEKSRAYGKGFLHGSATGAGICIAAKGLLFFL